MTVDAGGVPQFSELERAFIEEPMWFGSLRILERHPEFVTADFSRRLALAAEASDDEPRSHVIDQMAQLISRVAEIGLEQAGRETLGESGILAGQAREARSRYYETGDARELGQAVDRFMLALLCDDDPLRFGRGGTLMGFGATLIDLADAIEDAPAIINHVGCLAYLGCITANFAVVTMPLEDDWAGDLARAIDGVRSHLEPLEAREPPPGAQAFYAAVRAACAQIETALEARPVELPAMLTASFAAMALAFACVRAEIPVPGGGAALGPDFERASGAWLAVVLQWIERYGSDCLRVHLAMPPDGSLETSPDEDEGAASSEQVAPATPEDDEAALEAALRPLEAMAREAAAALGGGPPVESPSEVLALLMTAVLTCSSADAAARRLVATAQEMLDAGADDAATVADSPAAAFLCSHETLTTLAAATRACVDLEATQTQRFRGVREALPLTRLEAIFAVLEPALAEAPDDRAPTPAVVAVHQTAIVVRDLTALLAASTRDLGLPHAERYMAIRDRFNELLFGGAYPGRSFAIESDAATPEMDALIGRFERDIESLEGSERDELCAWLGAAYDGGRLSFAGKLDELTFLLNLGWLCLQASLPETFTWSERARRLALELGAMMDVATADLNAASCYLRLVQVGLPSWSFDGEQAQQRLAMIIGGLAHALEALRIVTVASGLSDPDDRYHVGSVGYAPVRELIERLLLEAEDLSLLAEYLLNARGMWFLLDLYQLATGEGGADEPPERAVVSWRGRSWVAQSLAVDGALWIENENTNAAEIDVADVLAPGGEPQALWFGNMLDRDAGALASVLIVPPKTFAAAFARDAEALGGLDGLSCLEAAEALGELVPDELWGIADGLCGERERATLFVSLDAGLPPVSMGLWRRATSGGARVLADAFDVVYCPSVAPRRGAVPWVGGQRAPAAHVYAVCDPLGDLPEARIVPALAREVLGNGRGRVSPPANRATVLALLDACALADGVFLYQGHSESGALDRPDAACLALEPVDASGALAERLSMSELLRAIPASASGRMPRRAAFLSCGSGVAQARHDATGIAMAALAAGSDAVLSTLRPVADTASWRTVVEELVGVLCAPAPWGAFGSWQQQAAVALDALPSEDARWAVASLAMFGAPFVRGDYAGAAR